MCEKLGAWCAVLCGEGDFQAPYPSPWRQLPAARDLREEITEGHSLPMPFPCVLLASFEGFAVRCTALLPDAVQRLQRTPSPISKRLRCGGMPGAVESASCSDGGYIFFLSVAFLPDEGQPGSLEEANCCQNGKSCPPGEGVSRGNACPLNSASGGQESGSVLSGASVSALW